MRVLKSRIVAVVPGQIPSPTPDLLASFVGTSEVRQKAAKVAKQKKRGPTPVQVREKLLEDCRERMRTKNWEGATASTLVALYFICHELVYGVPPLELTSGTHWKRATMMAGGLVKTQFGGDTTTAIRWMRWVWNRQQMRLQWSKQNNREGSRLTYNSLFGWLGHVSDWRARQTA